MRVLKQDQKVVKIRVHYINEQIKDYQLSEEEYEHFKEIKGNKNKEEYLVDADKITDRLYGGATTNLPYRVFFEIRVDKPQTKADEAELKELMEISLHNIDYMDKHLDDGYLNKIEKLCNLIRIFWSGQTQVSRVPDSNVIIYALRREVNVIIYVLRREVFRLIKEIEEEI